MIEKPRKRCKLKRREGDDIDDGDGERLYKMDEVKKMVSSAVQKYQALIKEEYEKILTQQLKGMCSFC